MEQLRITSDPPKPLRERRPAAAKAAEPAISVMPGDGRPRRRGTLGAFGALGVFGVVALWGAAWSSHNGPFYLPASGLTYDVGPANIHLVKKIAADPLHLDEYGYAYKDFLLPDPMGSGTKYIQATTKMNAFWAKTNFDTFVINP